MTFHELLLSIFFIQVNNDRSCWLLRFPLLAHHKALLHGQQTVHLITHQQHSSISGPVLHNFSPGQRCSGGHTASVISSSYILNTTPTRTTTRYVNILVLIVENVNLECSACDECGVGVRGKGFLGREPEVELRQPVLKRVHLQLKKQSISLNPNHELSLGNINVCSNDYMISFNMVNTFITHRNNGQHSVSLSIPQQYVNEGNDLQGLAQPHAVSEDAPKATAGLIAFQRLDEVVIKKPDSPDLRNKETNV